MDSVQEINNAICDIPLSESYTILCISYYNIFTSTRYSARHTCCAFLTRYMFRSKLIVIRSNPQQLKTNAKFVTCEICQILQGAY